MAQEGFLGRMVGVLGCKRENCRAQGDKRREWLSIGFLLGGDRRKKGQMLAGM